jgi:hypothetical protein
MVGVTSIPVTLPLVRDTRIHARAAMSNLPAVERKSINDLCWASKDPVRQAQKRTDAENSRRNVWRTRFREAAFRKSLIDVAEKEATGAPTLSQQSIDAGEIWTEIRQFLGHAFGTVHFEAAAEAMRQWWESRWLLCAVAQRKQVWLASDADVRGLLSYVGNNAFEPQANLPWLCIFRMLIRELVAQAEVPSQGAAAANPAKQTESQHAGAQAAQEGEEEEEEAKGEPEPNCIDDEDAADDADFWNDVEEEEDEEGDGDDGSSSDDGGEDASERTMQWLFTDSESEHLLLKCRQLLFAENTPVEVLEVICHICDSIWTVPQLQENEVPCRAINVDAAFQLLNLTVQRDRAAMMMMTGGATQFADVWTTVLYFLLHAMPMRSELLSRAEAAALLPLLQHIAGRVGHLQHRRVAVSFLGVLHLTTPLQWSQEASSSSASSITAAGAVATRMPLLMSPPWASLLQTFAALPSASTDMTSHNWGSAADAWRTLRTWAAEHGTLLAANVELGTFVLAQLAKVLHATPILTDGKTVRHGHGLMLDCWNSVAEVACMISGEDTIQAAQFRHNAINVFAPWFATGENASLLRQIERAWTRTASTNVHARRLLPMVQCLQQSFLRLLSEWCMMQSPDSLAKQFPSFVLAPLTRYLQVLSEFAVESVTSEQQRRQQTTTGVLNTSAVSDVSVDSNQSGDVVLFPVIRESCVTQFNTVLEVLQALLFASLPESEWCAMLQQPQSNASIWWHVARVANTLRAGITSVLGEKMHGGREINPVRRLLRTMLERYPSMYHAELHSHVVDWPEEVDEDTDPSDSDDSEDEQNLEAASAAGEDASMD